MESARFNSPCTADTKILDAHPDRRGVQNCRRPVEGSRRNGYHGVASGSCRRRATCNYRSGTCWFRLRTRQLDTRNASGVVSKTRFIVAERNGANPCRNHFRRRAESRVRKPAARLENVICGRVNRVCDNSHVVALCRYSSACSDSRTIQGHLPSPCRMTGTGQAM